MTGGQRESYLMCIEVWTRAHVFVRVAIFEILLIPLRRRRDDRRKRDRKDRTGRRILVLGVRRGISQEIYVCARGEALWHPAQLGRQLADFLNFGNYWRVESDLVLGRGRRVFGGREDAMSAQMSLRVRSHSKAFGAAWDGALVGWTIDVSGLTSYLKQTM